MVLPEFQLIQRQDILSAENCEYYKPFRGQGFQRKRGLSAGGGAGEAPERRWGLKRGRVACPGQEHVISQSRENELWGVLRGPNGTQ